MSNLNVSIVQTQLHWHDPSRNLERLSRLLEEAQPQTDLIVLPEMFTTGFTMAAAEQAESMNGPAVAWMRQQAERWQALIVGSLIIEENGRYYNRLVAVEPKGGWASYDKRHLFRMAKEQEHYSPGKTRLTLEYKGWRIRPFICYDLRFPVWSRNAPAANGLEYDMALYVANWPERRGGQWTKLLQARAIENQCYVAGVNRVGLDGNGIAYRGDSAVYDPWGDALTQIVRGEAVETVSLDLEKLHNYQQHFPAWQDADSFQLME